ncbi:Os12g0195183, partial [Oryza sativa Japonica Group]
LSTEGTEFHEVADEVGDGARGGGGRHDEAGDGERPEPDPQCAAAPHAALRDVHLRGEVDGERPEGDGTEEADDDAEEGQRHGDHGGEADEHRAPRQPERADGEGPHPELAVDEAAVGPPARRLALDEGEDRLAVHLVGADEVHGDGDVGGVDEPERLEEAESGEEVVRRRVAERRVAHPPAQRVEHRRRHDAQQRRLLHHLRLRRRRRLDRVLDLGVHVGEGEREGDVAQRLQRPPRLLRGGDVGDAGDRAAEPAVGDGLGDAEAEADAGVGEGHDGGDDGQPPDLVEVGDLREDDLEGAEDEHVRGARDVARDVVAIGVEAARPLDGLHADGGGDGVADGGADEVGVLDDAAELGVGAAEDGADGADVGVVAGAGLLVAGAVALGLERGGEVGDAAEHHHHGGPADPPELRRRPRQRQHPGPDHGGDDVRARRPERAGAARPPVVVEQRRVRLVAGLQ